jgi:hypothetical protein
MARSLGVGVDAGMGSKVAPENLCMGGRDRRDDLCSLGFRLEYGTGSDSVSLDLVAELHCWNSGGKRQVGQLHHVQPKLLGDRVRRRPGSRFVSRQGHEKD